MSRKAKLRHLIPAVNAMGMIIYGLVVSTVKTPPLIAQHRVPR